MRVVLDTNVFVSGVFFSGPPYNILDAWRAGKAALVISPAILEEYRRTGQELARRFQSVNLTPWLELVAVKAIVLDAPRLLNGCAATRMTTSSWLALSLAGRRSLQQGTRRC